MSHALLVLNAGSSSVKFSLFDARARPQPSDLLCQGQFAGIGHRVHFTASDRDGVGLADEQLPGATHHEVLDSCLSWLRRQFPRWELLAAGHRIVHGGTVYAAPVRIDAAVLAQLRRLIPLAPLHQPHNLAAVDAVAKLHRGLLQVACFDTAFHHTQPQVAAAFALPAAIVALGIRRYGFHGLSYEYIAGMLPQVLGSEACEGRIIVAHLGGGASMCALHRRRSVATTMSFTALDGLPMGSRCGSLDPGVVLYLIQEAGMSVAAVTDLLYKSSGLLGVSGISDDMRTLLASCDARAADAIALYIYRIGRELGSLAAALGGLDALVFTGGVGEHAARIRAEVCRQAAWLGIALDEVANTAGAGCITLPRSAVGAWIIATDEDLVIARHAWDLRTQR